MLLFSSVWYATESAREGSKQTRRESSDLMNDKQHDWFTPEGRVAAWNEIDKNLPGVREAYEEEKIKKAVQDGGGKFVSVMDCSPYAENLVLFNSPATGSTLALEVSLCTADAVKKRITESDETFKAAANKYAVKSFAAGGGPVAEQTFSTLDDAEKKAEQLNNSEDWVVEGIYKTTS